MKGELRFEGQNVGSSLYLGIFFFKGGISLYERDLGHYGEGVHQSKILGEWSDLINYEMGVSPTRVYTTTNIFFGGEFKRMDEKFLR